MICVRVQIIPSVHLVFTLNPSPRDEDTAREEHFRVHAEPIPVCYALLSSLLFSINLPDTRAFAPSEFSSAGLAGGGKLS